MSYHLVPLDGGQPIPIVKTKTLVGRNCKKSDVRLAVLGVSKTHGRLTWQSGELTVEDMGSANGVWVNGERVQQAQLKIDDVIAFGPCQFRVERQATAVDRRTSQSNSAVGQTEDSHKRAVAEPVGKEKLPIVTSRIRQPTANEPLVHWQSANWWRSVWSQLANQRPRAKRILVTASVVGCLAWWIASPTDDADVQECRAVYQQLIAGREQGQPVGQSWTEFTNEVLPRIAAIANRLEKTATSQLPRRQALLYAVRDGLLIVLKDTEHFHLPLSARAKHREAAFLQNLGIASGELSLETIYARSGVLPTPNAPAENPK